MSVPGGPPIRISCSDVLAGRLPEGVPRDLDPRIIEGFLEDCQRVSAREQEQLRQLYEGFTLPGSLLNSLAAAQSIGVILIVILAASMVGTEYAWGTLRAVLLKGTGRWSLLGSKVALLALLAAGALVIVDGLTVLSSLLASALTAEAPSGGSTAEWGPSLVMMGRSWFALLPYLALAACLTVLTSSSAVGMALTLGYYFGEQIAVAILLNVFDWFRTVADYLLGRNVTAWMIADRGEGLQGAFVGLGAFGEFPGGLHAFLVLVVYIVVLGAIAFRVFQRRDVAGASGG
jgi:ABC-type transport system involved in multi-copper enzyme maturation permease subunit